LAAKKQEKPLDYDDKLGAAAFVGKSLSDENRLRILLSLDNGRKTVSAIVEEVNLSQPLVSHHLKELRRCLLVKVERKGLFVYYEIADRKVVDIVRDLSHLATNLLSKRDTF
jgi:ArsR family transcriptional regulator, zinc-responsive transcriptional repressor